MNIAIFKAFSLAAGFIAVASVQAAMTDHRAVPPNQYVDVDPNVMINLSVETPMGGAAYNDQNDGGDCSGRISVGGNSDIGACYSPSKTYLGYFDPNKCYTYQNGLGRFEPDGDVNNTDHECTNKFSGNFMNWASMTAIDIFAWTMTGGNRVVDDSSTTVIERKRKQNNDSWFPIKYLKSTTNVSPSSVTPFSESEIYIYNTDFGIDFGTTYKGNEKGSYNLQVEVCDESEGVEENCKSYGGNYKPEGLIQNNAYRMRYAVMSYLLDGSQDRDGGVLRANMKYVGPYRKATDGGLEVNPNAEWSSTTGILVTNPDSADATASSVTNSGVINYINKFGSNGYKSYDPVSELFYECINYFKDRGPTTEYSSGLTSTMKDGFPVITDWDDPIQHSCQGNYIIGINDANPWMDKSLPGTTITNSNTFYTSGWGGSDWGEPSNPDPDIDVTALTDTVGDLQGITNSSRNIGCVGNAAGDCDMDSSNAKTITNLGEAFGTHPYAPKQNSYYVAGLAYYANTSDIRSDFSGEQNIRTFMIDTQEYSNDPLTGEMNMLWLAGKYGGFEDSNNNDEPDLAVEWDEDGDGEPDNYVLATDPAKLVAGLSQAFASISNRVSAGSSAAVIANSASATGAVIQAMYQPKADNTTTGQQVQWVGMMHAVFIDDLGNLREDGNGNRALDGYGTDRVIEFYFDTTEARTRVKRYTTTDGITLSYYDTVEIPDLGVLWNTRDELAALNNNSIDTQRTYTDAVSANKTRHILTWIDDDTDGVVDGGETKAFTDSVMSSYYRYLDVADSTTAENIVNFVRGQEGISGYRSRTIDYDNDGTDEVWRQGDIVHSSPFVVGAPSADYDTRIGDTTYTEFREQYRERRQVVYAGGNDGLLHAYNAGFFDAANSEFLTQMNSETQHPIGAELWAYAPMNLLPHLQWLKELDYPHVYYVDGPVKAYDVNIFPDDATHPNGWGTILVAGMRLGGNSVSVDTDGDSTDDWTSRSAYIVMDVTDPESPPELLAEITHTNLGFTTSVPTMTVQRTPGDGIDWTNPARNEWTLVFGSGPNTLLTATSDQTAKLYLYDLNLNSDGEPNGFISGFAPTDLGISNSFVGNVATKDWHRDLYDDAVYFGIAGNTIASPNGRLMRLVPGADAMTGSTISTVINPGQPFVAAPTFGSDEQGNWWVYAGTGRMFVRDDNLSSTTQSFYGIKDPISDDLTVTTTIARSDLIETTNVQVYADGSINDVDGVIVPSLTNDTFTELQSLVAQNDGWFMDLPGGSPSSRSVSNPAFVRTMLLFTSYMPPADICDAEGSSRLYAVYYKTGTAYPDSGLGNDSTVTNAEGAELTQSYIDLGEGQASDVVIYQTSKSTNTIINMGTGALLSEDIGLPTIPSGRQSWREIQIE